MDTNQQSEPLQVRILIFKGRRKWVAQCLEFDIAVQADRPEELQERFYSAANAERVFCELRGLTPFTRLPRAPKRFFDTWERLQADESQEPWQNFPSHIANAQTAVTKAAP